MDALPTNAAHAYIQRLLFSGIALGDLVCDLLESFDGREPWPGEDNFEVLLEMLGGSVSTHLRDVPPEEFERATVLIERAVDAVLADLRRATELASRPRHPRRRGTDLRRSAHR